MSLALLRGIVLGFVAGIPIGPVNAAVIDTAMRKCMVRALWIGIGGAFVDFVYSQIAVLGLKALFDDRPALQTLLLGLGGIVLVAFGYATARNAAVDEGPAKEVRAPVVGRAALTAFATGILITVANPAALVSWVLLAGTVLADLTMGEAFMAGFGIFVGTSLWFLLIAWLAARGRVKLGQKSVWIPRAVGTLLVAYGAFLVVKATVVVWAYGH